MALDVAFPELAFALDAVEEAAQLARRIQSGMAVQGVAKSDMSPVTVADFAGQAVVARRLMHHFPADVLVAEEDSGELRKPENAVLLDTVAGFVGERYPGHSTQDVCGWIDRGRAESASRFWTLDPIDGTKGYLRGGQYAVALALVEHGVVTLGVLACPNLGEECRVDTCSEGMLAAAVRGQGAWAAPMGRAERRFEPLQVSPCRDIAQARILRSFEAGHTNTSQIDRLAAALGITADPVLMDSQAKYAVLAAGGGELLFRLLSPKKPDYRERIWDQAAGSIVLEEAGGTITDLDGKPLDFTQGRALAANRGVCASNGLLHDAALEALRRTEEAAH